MTIKKIHILMLLVFCIVGCQAEKKDTVITTDSKPNKVTFKTNINPPLEKKQTKEKLLYEETFYPPTSLSKEKYLGLELLPWMNKYDTTFLRSIFISGDTNAIHHMDSADISMLIQDTAYSTMLPLDKVNNYLISFSEEAHYLKALYSRENYGVYTYLYYATYNHDGKLISDAILSCDGADAGYIEKGYAIFSDENTITATYIYKTFHEIEGEQLFLTDTIIDEYNISESGEILKIRVREARY